MGGNGPEQSGQVFYAPAPPTPSVWALKPPSWALVHKTTYAPMIYAALCIMFWMHFLGPKWHSFIGLMPFHRAQKTLKFQGLTPSHLPW